MDDLIKDFANEFSTSALLQIANTAFEMSSLCRRNYPYKDKGSLDLSSPIYPKLRDAADTFAMLSAYCRKVVDMQG